MNNYDNSTRGKIMEPKRKKQLIDFSGLAYCKDGKGTPTDVDGFLERSKRAFIFYEYKYKDNKMPDGQKYALVNTIDGLCDAGRFATLLIARHEQNDPEKEIDGANSIVEQIYYNHNWYEVLDRNETVKTVTDRFFALAGFN